MDVKSEAALVGEYQATKESENTELEMDKETVGTEDTTEMDKETVGTEDTTEMEKETVGTEDTTEMDKETVGTEETTEMDKETVGTEDTTEMEKENNENDGHIANEPRETQSLDTQSQVNNGDRKNSSVDDYKQNINAINDSSAIVNDETQQSSYTEKEYTPNSDSHLNETQTVVLDSAPGMDSNLSIANGKYGNQELGMDSNLSIANGGKDGNHVKNTSRGERLRKSIAARSTSYLTPLYIDNIVPDEPHTFRQVFCERTKGPGYLYILSESSTSGQSGDLLKVGVTNDLKMRLRDIQNGNPRPLIPELLLKVRDMETIVDHLEDLLREYKYDINGGKGWYKAECRADGSNAVLDLINDVKLSHHGIEIPPAKFKDYMDYFINFV